LPRRPRPAARRPAFSWLAAAASIGAVAGGSIVAALEPEIVSISPRPPGDLTAAADLRRQAVAACDAKEWARCLAELDEARAADPKGDESPAVKSLRDKAIAGILK
jgi:hypothetical protein